MVIKVPETDFAQDLFMECSPKDTVKLNNNQGACASRRLFGSTTYDDVSVRNWLMQRLNDLFDATS